MNFPQSHQDLLRNETKAFVSLATVMKDGSPQVTPVWFSWDGQYVLINSAEGRLKDQNMRNRPEVALIIIDPTNPYRYLQVRGRVERITTEGAREHIDALSLKYTGNPKYQGPPSDVRVMYFINPEHVSGYG
jgi:PPOX class probable F420-dependent enzyme